MRALKTSILLFCLSLFAVVSASASGLPWKDHQRPFDFTFGNHIDTHQQMQVLPDGSLFGYLYISFTGESDENGIPIAQHKDCNAEGVRCSVGWEIRGLPGEATFVSHQMGDHPIWEVNRAELPTPGAYTHFHWLGWPEHAHELLPTGEPMPGYFIQLIAKDTFLFKHGNDQVLVTNGSDNATHINIVSGLSEGSGGHGH
jgi:hypothetical protein